jgi:NAD+ synthase (glutamine-hydrolysing)
MSNKMLRIAQAQINTTVGDLKGNQQLILENIRKCEEAAVDVVVFPELAVTGYPPEDLLFKSSFINANLNTLTEIARQTGNIVALVGFADRVKEKSYNAVGVLYHGKIIAKYHKIALPNYGVFDEKRYFIPGEALFSFQIKDLKLGLTICEDIWTSLPIPEQLVFQNEIEILINISASPYHRGKGKERERLLTAHAISKRVFIVYTNLVGGQDELVFDGQSLILDEAGEILEQGKQFREDLIVADLDVTSLRLRRTNDSEYQQRKATFSPSFLTQHRLVEYSHPVKVKPPLPGRKERSLGHSGEIYQALVLGTRDYVQKNGFKKVVLGLSGGIDSTLCAVIGADALGKENVIGVAMPSPFSSRESVLDAEALAKNLGIQFLVVPISDVFDAYKKMLRPVFLDLPEDVTEENIQARIRGNLLMALSNKYGWLPISTGNKSEVGVGYCTLYGDMAGGFAIIKDVPKTVVYQLAKYRNSYGGVPVIPESCITKAPSAELRPNQFDEDSLPNYAVLDAILEAYVEKDMEFGTIVQLGYPEDVVREVIRMVDLNEYKRRQSAPGIKITPRAFGKDRRMPLTNRYRNQ